MHGWIFDATPSHPLKVWPRAAAALLRVRRLGPMSVGHALGQATLAVPDFPGTGTAGRRALTLPQPPPPRERLLTFRVIRQ